MEKLSKKLTAINHSTCFQWNSTRKTKLLLKANVSIITLILFFLFPAAGIV